MELQNTNNCNIILGNLGSPKHSHSHSHRNSHSSTHSVEGNLKIIKNSWESLDSSKLEAGCLPRVRKVTLDVSSSQLAAAESTEHQWESSSTGEESRRAGDWGAQAPDRADWTYRPVTGKPCLATRKSSHSSSDHTYEEILDTHSDAEHGDTEEKEEDEEGEEEDVSFLSLISLERRNHLRFYGCTGWE